MQLVAPVLHAGVASSQKKPMMRELLGWTTGIE